MKKPSVRANLNNEKGLAMIETLPILIIFIVLLSYGLGLFGVVHTAILNSMAARTYAFESFRNRSDVSFFRDRNSDGEFLEHKSSGNRVHFAGSDNVDQSLDRNDIYATTRDLVFPPREMASLGNADDHNSKIYDIRGRNRKGGIEASPAWVMVGYGICINRGCGD